MQDRYYRYYGVTTSFLTNLTNLEIAKPDDYSEDAVNEILDDTAAARTTRRHRSTRRPMGRSRLPGRLNRAPPSST